MSMDMSRQSQDNHPLHPIDSGAGRDLRGPKSASSDDVARRLEAVMHSPYGVEKLLNRLKQSIFSAREFSSFLRERSILEDRYAQGYRKLVRHTSDSLRRQDAKQGSYARNLDESMRINDRMAENGIQLAATLQSMSDELRELAENAERGRKHWKHTALDAEKKVATAENDQQKARDRFNNAAEQYERVRTGERQGGKFGLKNKSPAQQEEALKEKADSLDQEYAARTQAAQAERHEYESVHKPQIVRSIRDLVGECDASMSMQLAKLASISEKHVVSNGMAIAPIKGQDGQSRGLRQIASEIDDRRDFSDFMLDGAENMIQTKPPSRDEAAKPFHQMQSTQSVQHIQDPNINTAPRQSNPPQLPQIGGDSFSFDARPGAQSQPSFVAGIPDAISGPSQQTGTTHDSFGSGRNDMPSLPSFDRGTAPAAMNGRTSIDGPGARRQETLPGAGFGRSESPEYGRQNIDNAPQRPPNEPAYANNGMGRGMPPHIENRAQPGFGSASAVTGMPPHPDSRAGQPGFDGGMDRGVLSQDRPLQSNNMPAGRGMPPQSNDRAPFNQSQPPHLVGGFVPPNGGRGEQLPHRNESNQPGFGQEQYGNRPRQASNPPPNSQSFDPQRQGVPNSQPGFAQRQESLPPNSQPLPGQQRQGSMPPNSQPLGQQRSGSMSGQPGYGDQHHLDLIGPPPMPPQAHNVGRGGPAPGSYMDPGKNAVAGGRGNILPSQRQQHQASSALPPLKPVFGVSLDELFRRDGSAVPLIVFLCIQAVDNFGTNTEGIYRIPGSTPIVTQLKSEFDHGMSSSSVKAKLTIPDSSKVLLSDPASFNHDISSVATLLKNFLRDLPDPLLTNAAYHSFIQAAKYEDNIMRRDGLHQFINGLPDPNYATLRVLILHLHRIAMNSDNNKMDMRNLSIVFGPTVMGGTNVTDAGWQTKVMETILQHTHDIFDPDE